MLNVVLLNIGMEMCWQTTKHVRIVSQIPMVMAMENALNVMFQSIYQRINYYFFINQLKKFNY